MSVVASSSNIFYTWNLNGRPIAPEASRVACLIHRRDTVHGRVLDREPRTVIHVKRTKRFDPMR